MTTKPLPSLAVTTNSFSHDLVGSIEFRNWTLGEQQDTLFKKSDDKPVYPILLGILKNCITSCKDSKGNEFKDISDMPLSLGEMAFLKIREVSVSDKQDFIVECENPDCKPRKEGDKEVKERHIVTVDLSEAYIHVPEGFKDFITIGKYRIGVKMPSLSVLGAESVKDLNANDLDFIVSNINYIICDDEVWDFTEYSKDDQLKFVKSLPPSFTVAFVNNWKHLPIVKTPCEGKCKACGNEVKKDIIGVTSLFMG